MTSDRSIAPNSVLAENIPADLKKREQWVIWQHDNGKKVPFDANDPVGANKAKTNDESTWSSFTVALQAAHSASFAGIGYCLSDSDGLICIDLDELNDETRADEARNIMWKFKHTYIEFSPSGGVHIWLKGSLPASYTPGCGSTNKWIEVFHGASARFVTVTGKWIEGSARHITDCQQSLDWLLAEFKTGHLSHQSPAPALDGAAPYNAIEKLDSAMEFLFHRPEFDWDDRAIWQSFMAAMKEDRVPLEKAIAYSQRSSKFDANDTRRVWESFKRTDGVIATLANTVFKLAADLGWKYAKQEQSVTQKAVQIALHQVDLWTDTEGAAYATVGPDHLPLTSQDFRRWLRALLYKSCGMAAREDTLKEVALILECEALKHSLSYNTARRVGRHEANLYVDLVNEKRQVIEVSETGWRVILSKECPVKFIRSKKMLALPLPDKNGKIDDFYGLLNQWLLTDEDKRLIVAFTFYALQPDGPYPLLQLDGEAEAGKTHLTRILKKTVDPTKPLDRGFPKTIDDLNIAATTNQLLAYDNCPHVTPTFSDGLCRLTTGAGDAGREFYEQKSEVTFEAARPVILNAVGNIITRSDLLSRTIVIYPKRLGQYSREHDLWQSFEKSHPRILGGLLNALSAALKNLPSVSESTSFRLADFVAFVSAAARELGMTEEVFLSAYENNRRSRSSIVRESPLAIALKRLVDKKISLHVTTTELLKLLVQNISEEHCGRLPNTPDGLGSHIARIAQSLRDENYIVEMRKKGGNRAWYFESPAASQGHFESPSNGNVSSLKSARGGGVDTSTLKPLVFSKRRESN